jgi:hypothetical protein
MATYWSEKRSHPVRVDQSLIERVVSAARPDFETVIPLHSLSRSIEHELVRLTENQFRALDALVASPRVLFEGGAGTGKTLLAVEACRRATASGSRVLYTCTSPYIAAHVRADPQMAGAEVETLDRLDTAQRAPYDLLVVDEAQDVMTYEDLGLLDRLLAGGLDEGRWLMFMDSNNQRGLVGGYDQEAMDYLMSFRPAVYALSDNCRNTREIVAATQRVTGADVGVTSAGSGPAVGFIAADPNREVANVVRVLSELKDQGIDLADVTLLSDREFGTSCFSRLPSKWCFLIDHLDLSATSRRPAGRIGFARISDFKGLESPFVIAETTGGAGAGAEHRRSLYVGMTRARIGLWIVGDDEGDSGAG